MDSKKPPLAVRRRKNIPQQNPGCKLDYQATQTTSAVLCPFLFTTGSTFCINSLSSLDVCKSHRCLFLKYSVFIAFRYSWENSQIAVGVSGDVLYYAKKFLEMVKCCQDHTNWKAFSNVPASQRSKFQSTRNQIKPRLK